MRGLIRAGVAFLAVWGGTAAAAAQTKPIDAVATIGMIADVVENVAGDCAAVTAIMGPGVDPHLFQASAGNVATFRRADVIFYSGYSLEGQLGEVLGRFSETKPTVALAPASIDPSNLISVEDVYGIDPHLWMDVSQWSKIVPTIVETLTGLSPECGDAMASRAAAYRDQLAALHDWTGEAIATIPEAQRILVTAHDAFSYYGRAYGIEVAGIQGISTESEAGVADVRAMASLVAERMVPAIFVESTINPRTIQAVIDAARERGHEVRLGGSLYSDAMGQPGTAGGTYIGMIYENTRAITEALGGALPPLPAALTAWAEEWEMAGVGDAG